MSREREDFGRGNLRGQVAAPLFGVDGGVLQNVDELQGFAATSGFVSLFDDGIQRVLEGRTTLEEISRVINAS